MELGETLGIVNLAGLVILAFFGWTGMKAVKQHLTDLMNRDLSEIRRQIRTSTAALDRVRDHAADNREDILKIEVNIASMQDELEAMSRRLDKLRSEQGDAPELEDGEGGDASEQRHLYE